LLRRKKNEKRQKKSKRQKEYFNGCEMNKELSLKDAESGLIYV